MNKLKEKFNELNTGQKIFIFLIVALGLFLTYVLTTGLTIFFLMPELKGNLLSKVSSLYTAIERNFALDLPIIALKGGYLIEVLKSFLIAFCAVIFLLLSVVYATKKRNKERNVHGKANWSTKSELAKKNLLDDNGIIVGKYKGELLKFGGQEFASLGAPTRSGKGVAVVIPNLLEWENSIVVLDVKKECFNFTSAYRQKILKQDVFLFNPFSYETHCYNPLLYLDFSKPNIELKIQALAVSLYPTGRGGKDFFPLQAQNIFVAIVYLLGKLKEEELLGSTFSLTTLAGALQGIKIDLGDSNSKIPLDEVVAVADEMDLLTDTIKSKFDSFFEQAEAKDQFAGVKGSYETPLKIFQDSLFEKATSHNDFDFRDLRVKKISIYIGISPDDLEIARPILNLFFQQLLLENIAQGMPEDNPALNHNVLLLMDEFTSMGYMQQYQTSLTYMAGYDIRSLIIYQNETQLSETPPLGYGDKGMKTLLENHSCNVVYRPKEPIVAEQFSKRIGNITIEASSLGTNSKDPLNASRNRSLQQKALILPQDIMDLADDEEILFCNGAKVICKKAFYFNDPYFIEKLGAVSPIIKGKKVVSKELMGQAYQRGDLAIDLPNNYNSNEEINL